jgi:hypothetical protein
MMFSALALEASDRPQPLDEARGFAHTLLGQDPDTSASDTASNATENDASDNENAAHVQQLEQCQAKEKNWDVQRHDALVMRQKMQCCD